LPFPQLWRRDELDAATSSAVANEGCDTIFLVQQAARRVKSQIGSNSVSFDKSQLGILAKSFETPGCAVRN
jgi:hypothetical protein